MNMAAKRKFQPPQFNNYPPFDYFENFLEKPEFEKKQREEIVLFMHLPFCMQKCGYCALSSVIRDPNELEPVIKTIKKEIDLYAEKVADRKVVAALLGGGTPSNLLPEQISDLYGYLYKKINFVPNAEVTVEVRPKTIDEAKIKAFMKAGVNRISFGVQTLIPEELELCGRQNTEEVVKEAMEIVRSCGINNINFDMIAGLPRQTEESLKITCEKVFGNLRPNHVSLYSLIVHPDTAFAQLYKRSPELFADDEMKSKFYDIFFAEAEKYGYVRTSTENVALKDEECSHYQRLNWQGYERLAIGPEAIGFVGGNQYVNKSWKNGYIADVESGNLPVVASCHLNEEQIERRKIILGLHNVSLDKNKISSKYGEIWQRLINEGLVKEVDDKFLLTEEGKKYLYQVQIEFYESYLPEAQRGLAGVTKR